MVEYALNFDNVFKSLGDPTRRDILQRLTRGELTVGAIAERYAMSLAAISKHLSILQRAKLVSKRRQGNEQVVSLNPATLATTTEYLRNYQVYWDETLASLDRYLGEERK